NCSAFSSSQQRLVSYSKRGITDALLHFGRSEFHTGGTMNFDGEPFDTDVPMQTKKTKPIHEVRLGLIKAAVWKNETENGARYSVTFTRIYKDKNNEEDPWKFTPSFGRDDLLLVSKVADLAHSWIYAQTQEDERAAKGQS